jgi:RNA polymerase sigma factor (TIGR02999 family)
MTDVTRILSQIELDPSAADQLLPLVYDELRELAAARLASERPGQTLQATALVHEAYVRLVDQSSPQEWDGRGHFFAAAAESMRRILINRARDKKRLKRGGDFQRLNLEKIELALDTPAEELLALDEAMQLLAEEDALSAELVKLRFFAGLSQHQAAESLGIARHTADRQWAYARVWLYDCLEGNTKRGI